MPEYQVQWSGEIVEFVGDSFVGEFESEQAAVEAGLNDGYDQGVDEPDVYVQLITND